ncbi:hypothetical protein [Methylobacterium sp. GC_Met_2]|uniref:hypothetical protein n=1 Tax=Methylobacterium sp. GC_Met_2 TaxID=2937376 RepID=UPI00226B9E29|nr:hypothetical protein [Methylobacterium sp. GC_Met_2]
MTFALLAALTAGTLCLGMLSVLMPLKQPREDVELGTLDEDDFLGFGGSIIDLEPIR